jgi:DNA polymerase-3 subunit delta
MIYIMYGKDTYSIQQDLRKIKEQYGNTELMEANTSVLDGKQLTCEQLCDICSAMPFLHTHRLVIVEGLLERFEPGNSLGRKSTKTKSRSDSGLKEWQSITDFFVKNMPESTVLIFVDGDVNRKANNPLLSLWGPHAKVRTYQLLKGDKLRSWIRDIAKQRGGTISRSAVDLLIELSGLDLWRLNNEIDKLIAFCAGDNIEEEDVKKLTSYTGDVNIFILVDAILEGRSRVAYESLRRLFQTGAAPSYIITMISRQLRLIVMVKDLAPRMNKAQVKNKTGIVSDAVLDRTLVQARAYSMEHIKAAYRKMLEADVAIKSGKYADEDLTIELLISELCENESART